MGVIKGLGMNKNFYFEYEKLFTLLKLADPI